MPTVFWTGGDWLERWAWQLAPRYMGNLAGTSIPENLVIEGTIPPPENNNGWRATDTPPYNPRDVSPRRPVEEEPQVTSVSPLYLISILALVLLLK